MLSNSPKKRNRITSSFITLSSENPPRRTKVQNNIPLLPPSPVASQKVHTLVIRSMPFISFPSALESVLENKLKKYTEDTLVLDIVIIFPYDVYSSKQAVTMSDEERVIYSENIKKVEKSLDSLRDTFGIASTDIFNKLINKDEQDPKIIWLLEHTTPIYRALNALATKPINIPTADGVGNDGINTNRKYHKEILAVIKNFPKIRLNKPNEIKQTVTIAYDTKLELLDNYPNPILVNMTEESFHQELKEIQTRHQEFLEKKMIKQKTQEKSQEESHEKSPTDGKTEIEGTSKSILENAETIASAKNTDKLLHEAGIPITNLPKN
jgi:hypothetical protein